MRTCGTNRLEWNYCLPSNFNDASKVRNILFQHFFCFIRHLKAEPTICSILIFGLFNENQIVFRNIKFLIFCDFKNFDAHYTHYDTHYDVLL